MYYQRWRLGWEQKEDGGDILLQELFPSLESLHSKVLWGREVKQHIFLKGAAYFRRKLPPRVGNRAALGPGSAEDHPCAVLSVISGCCCLAA